MGGIIGGPVNSFGNIISGLTSSLAPNLEEYKAQAVNAATAVLVWGVVVVVGLGVGIFFFVWRGKEKMGFLLPGFFLVSSWVLLLKIFGCWFGPLQQLSTTKLTCGR